MQERTRHRAVGAVVLLLVAAVVFPLVLESSPPGDRIPDEPDPAEVPVESPNRIRITTFGGGEETPLRAGSDEEAEPPDRASVALPAPTPAPTPAPAPAPAPAPVPPTDEAEDAAPTSGWAVQIGSFADPGNAERLREQIAARGYRVLTQRVETGDGKVRVRVLVGPDRTRGAAAAQRSRLRREVSIEGFLIRFPG